MEAESKQGVLCLMGALLLLAVSAGAQQTLGATARQLPQGSLKFMAYYQGEQAQTLNFNIANSGNCTSSNGVGFGCGQSGDTEAKGSGGQMMFKMLYQPWESFQYYVVGGLGDYQLNLASNTLTNQLTGDTPGWTFGGGLRAVILPDTDYSPAIAADVSAVRSQYKFNRIYPGGGGPTQNTSINENLGMTQYQVAVVASHLFTIVDAMDAAEAKEMENAKNGFAPLRLNGVKLEPYGGVKWTRIQTDLHDLQNGSHAGGQKDTISPFAGLRIPAYEHEAFFVEASFVDGYVYSGGMEIRFK